MIRNRNPPKPIDLSGGIIFVISTKMTPKKDLTMEIAFVAPRIGSRPTERRVISSKICKDETAMWMALRDLASNRLADLVEINMEPPGEA